MSEQISSSQRVKWLYLFIGAAVFVNLSGLFVTIMGPDGALYASIAKNMVTRNNYSDLFVEGKDWLDKPHLPFWAAALSFKIFGIQTWAYKLPAILCSLTGAAYTYKFAKSLYSKETGLWAALILLTAQHTLISNTDVRAEPYLTGFIIAAVYHYYKSLDRKWFIHLVIGSLFAACAVMTKGVFALIPIGGAIAGHLFLTKQWKLLLNLRWLVAAVVVLIFILPELWCLYQQFDLHPEKVVFGKHNVSGLRFFFWDSQFGRFFNTGPIKKASGDPFFFMHTILWAYLPWAFLFYIAVVQHIRGGIKKLDHKEWYNLCGAGLTFLIFSASKFQLPFYIVIIFPFFSILTANYINTIINVKALRRLKIMQGIVISLMLVVIGLLHFFFRPDRITVIALFTLLLSFALLVSTTFNKSIGHYKIWFQSAAVAFFVNIYFNTVYSPQLLKYQPDSEAAFWLNDQNTSHLPVVKVVNGLAYAIDFYLDEPVSYYRIGEQNSLPERPFLIYAETEAVPALESAGLKGEVLQRFKSYHITKLKGKFLNHHTRNEVLGTSQVILIK